MEVEVEVEVEVEMEMEMEMEVEVEVEMEVEVDLGCVYAVGGWKGTLRLDSVERFVVYCLSSLND